jgi:hypothetical protein
MTTYAIEVVLSDDPATTMFSGWDEDVTYHKALSFEAEAINAEDACEVAFAVCNSYPDELHCPNVFIDAVERYRNDKNRSLSVGDIVRIYDGLTWVLYSCERAGWKQREG